MYELGSNWLYVDGQCNYWVHAGDAQAGSWFPVRRGRLNEQEAGRIAADFRYESWEDVAGRWGEEQPIDGSWTVFFDGTRSVSCFGACERPAEGQDRRRFDLVRAMVTRQRSLVEELYGRSMNIDSGQMRLLTYSGRDPVEGSDLTPRTAVSVEWPLTQSITDVAVSVEDAFSRGYGESFLVAGDMDTSALRAVRRQFLAGELGPTINNVLVTTPRDSEERYFLYFRDTVPLENDQGLIAVP
jgi:hypothetical protein